MAIVQPNGAYGFKCLHDHCSEKGWSDFRAHLESLAGRKLPFKSKAQPKAPEQTAEKFVESGTSPTPKPPAEVQNKSMAHGVEEYEAATEAVLNYPLMGNDMISQYAHLLTQGTGIPYGHVRECLKNVLAFCLSNETRYPNHEKLYMRGWHFNLGDAESGKTTALTAVMDRWKPVLHDLGIWTDKLSSYGSLQYLTKGFQDHPHMMLYVTEGNTLATSNEHVPALFGGLSDLYDQPEISAGSYRNKSARCATAEGSCIICITPDDFIKAMQGKGVIGGGVLPRWTMSEAKGVIVNGEWVIPNEVSLNMLREKIKDRFNDVTVVETEEARIIRIALTTEMARPEAGRHAKRLIEYYRRECLLAAVFAERGTLGENVGIITKEIAEWAAIWARYQLHLRITYWPIDAGNDVERMCSAMRGLLKRAHPKAVSLKNLKDAANVYREGSGGIETFGRAYRAMMSNEDMRKVGENVKEKALFGLVVD